MAYSIACDLYDRHLVFGYSSVELITLGCEPQEYLDGPVCAVAKGLQPSCKFLHAQ